VLVPAFYGEGLELARVGGEKDSYPHLPKKTRWAEEVPHDSAFRLAIEGTKAVIQNHNLATGIHSAGKCLRVC